MKKEVTELKKAKEQDWIKLAYLMENNGSLKVIRFKDAVDKTHYKPQISIYLCDKKLKVWLLNKFGGRFHLNNPHANPKKKTYYWFCSSNIITLLCERLYNYLPQYKEEFDNLIEMRKTFIDTYRLQVAGMERLLTEEVSETRRKCWMKYQEKEERKRKE